MPQCSTVTSRARGKPLPSSELVPSANVILTGALLLLLTIEKSEQGSGWSAFLLDAGASLHTPSVSYLSVMATCSSMAEPVLAFQFPEMEVLLG